MTELLENALVGVIYLDRRGRVLEANARARSALMREEGLCEREGCLRARLADDDVRLGTLLARVLPAADRPSDSAASGSIMVERSPEMPRLALHITAAPAQWDGFARAGVAALALIVDPTAHPRIDAERLAATLGLTRAESRVAAALADGVSVREIAAATKRKESSVRWLIKQIHAKLRISRNTDLVRMVLFVTWGTGLWPIAPGSEACCIGRCPTGR